ncbi:hypothetical protein BSL82_10160 [Tardibacter chloracetimidivorans]|uniref:Uncharacterized protein n=1 Tax=Tardibacter chloracetimidivorans TaxID=1921510 RepID=A0A1L3ZVF6_9SPHN|nr:hypothetical protein [Tardibacter chloracetimidivorans]API59636.1 hypothetical protein BSL82_10160 [Tardibacter chloracetimidivorans]
MAIFDALLTFSTAQAVTATAVGTDKVDLSQKRDIGEGENLYVLFTVTEAATAAGAATVDFQVVVDDDSALGSPIVVGTSGPIGKADLVIGKQIAVRINPQLASKGERYLGVNYVVATGPLTAGKFSAGVVHGVQDGKKFYPSGYTVGS